MTKSSKISLENWQTFNLTREGQLEFWDRQSPHYDVSEMTQDNQGELYLVEALCKQYLSAGYGIEDLVTLGGAVGSRDPKVVLDSLVESKRYPQTLYFNDLSTQMTQRALETNLIPVKNFGVEVKTFPGLLHEVCELLPIRPRRVIVGVYRLEALVKANPHYGFPLSGFREYLKNFLTIGSSFMFQPIRISADKHEEQTTIIILDVSEPEESLLYKEDILQEMVSMESVDAVRVVARHQNKTGFFVSHWYSEQGFTKLMQSTFGDVRSSRMSLMPCAKGYVACIDPTNKEPVGIVTVLNNVVGNILPTDQFKALHAIADLTA